MIWPFRPRDELTLQIWCDPETLNTLDTYARMRMTFRNEAANQLILASIGQPVYRPLQLRAARRVQFTVTKQVLGVLDRIGPSRGEAFRALVRRYQ